MGIFPVSRACSAAVRALAAAALLLLVACSGTRPDRRLLHDTLYDYSSAIRWGELESALAHLDPEYRKAHPLDSVSRRRFDQLQVTGYYVRQNSEDAEGRVHQQVEIRLVNKHTQTERSVVDRQVWRWDPEARRWWLTTGLPDLAPGD